MLKQFLLSGKLQISYAKAELGPQKARIGTNKFQTIVQIGTKINRKLHYIVTAVHVARELKRSNQLTRSIPFMLHQLTLA